MIVDIFPMRNRQFTGVAEVLTLVARVRIIYRLNGATYA